MITQKSHIDINYINRLSFSLSKFKKVKKDVFNCRCPVCGDSKKNKRIGRFYFYVKKSQWNVWCHNCGYHKSLWNFIKEYFPTEFDTYKKETMLDSFKQREFPKVELGGTKPVFDETEDDDDEQFDDKLSVDTVLDGTTNLCDLPDDHPAKSYLLSRKFSDKELERLYYTDNFKLIAGRIDPESIKHLKDNEPRIIIPFINEFGQVEMMQGRSLDPNSKIKYLSIKSNDEVEKVFGLYEVDRDKPSYCVEGPFDSLFIENCLASCDANLTRVNADVYIFDNQPRNKEVVRYVQDAIDRNKKVVIWPFVPKKKIDINDMIIKGATREQIMQLIRKNTFSGIMAKAKFMQWKQI